LSGRGEELFLTKTPQHLRAGMKKPSFSRVLLPKKVGPRTPERGRPKQGWGGRKGGEHRRERKEGFRLGKGWDFNFPGESWSKRTEKVLGEARGGKRLAGW